ncbi:sulfatase-like hydrolase/transferase [Schlesneria paludicola]|uniref:sulfatase-like hydrolase/transferase n=1 Tax=Schlesneria paludicola TaxID=360056 RepID=UPI00029AAAB3|nr:sulfatase-like hydrolase/transferase [Schlesneria paludicola]
MSFLANRRLLVITALICVALIAAATTYWLGKSHRLNVILVTFDTTRADHLGIYGYQRGLTSSFDDFARNGVVFDRAYAPAPITLPSHATMLTGLYPPEHGLRVNGSSRLGDEIPVLPQILKQYGYDTGAFVAAFVLDSMFGLDRGFDTYDDDLSKATRSSESDELRRNGEEIVDSAISWITQRTSRPFFCWVHLYDAHGPYDMRAEQFKNQFEQNPYDAGVAVEIEQFGRLLQFLKERNLDKNTVVVVAGDHGEGLDDHMEIEHGMLVYNSTLHVPLAFAGPKIGQPGTRVAEAVSLVDLTPTLLDILQIPPPKQVSGRSLLEALKGNSIPATVCYAEAEAPFYVNRWCPLKTVISDRWKYIESTRPELYDLQHDPGEITNLIEFARDERQELQAVLDVMREKFDQHSAVDVKLSQQQQANLETLGYLSNGKFNTNAERRDTRVLPDVKDMLPYLAKYERARLAGLHGKLDDTIEQLRKLVQERDDYVGAFILLGDCLSREGRHDEAVEPYRSALNLVPEVVGIRLRLAHCFTAQGRYEEAEVQFREIVAQDPEIAQSHFQWGEVLYTLHQIDDALAQFRETIRIEPAFIAANMRLGEILTRLERYNDAAACYEQALKFDPRNTVALTALSTVLMHAGETGKAYQYARNAVELDSVSVDHRLLLGSILISLNRPREAIAEFREAQRLRFDDPRLLEGIQQAEAALSQGGE